MTGELTVKGVVALTTPAAEQEPIALAHIAKKLVFEAHPPTGMFAMFPIKKPVEIHYELAYATKGTQATEGKFMFDGSTTVRHECPVPPQLYEALNLIHIWAEPYGHVALRLKAGQDPAKGRLSLKVDSTSESRIGFIVRLMVLDSVVQYIVDEMNRNASSKFVENLRKINMDSKSFRSKAEKLESRLDGLHGWEHFRTSGQAEQARMRANELGNLAKMEWAGRVRSAESTMSRVFGLLLGGDAAWDHKPKIRPIWGAKNRLGNSESIYYYDIWSNMHYGYVGAVAGFSLETLLSGADFANFFDSFSRDPPLDRDYIVAGFELYSPPRKVTIDRVIDLVRVNDSKWRMKK
jgi:hypothetical protein